MVNELCKRDFKTKQIVVYKTTDIDPLLTQAIDKIKTEKSECELKGSGWCCRRVLRVELRVAKYNPLRGESCIQLPDKITNKRATINVLNFDQNCFKYAVLGKFVSKNAHRVPSYRKHENRYDWSCISFPVKLEDIPKFERKNNISINVYGLENKTTVYPLKSVDRELEDHRDLLYIKDGRNSHYCYITNFERLVRDQVTLSQHRILICKRCFAHFDDQYGKTAEEKLEDHMEECVENAAVIAKFPDEPVRAFKERGRPKKVR